MARQNLHRCEYCKKMIEYIDNDGMLRGNRQGCIHIDSTRTTITDIKGKWVSLIHKIKSDNSDESLDFCDLDCFLSWIFFVDGNKNEKNNTTIDTIELYRDVIKKLDSFSKKLSIYTTEKEGVILSRLQQKKTLFGKE